MSNPPVLHTGTSRFESGVAYSKDWSEKLKDLWFKKSKGRPKRKKKISNCLYCNGEFEVKKLGQKRETKYCSHQCYTLSSRKIYRPPKKQLLQEIEETNYCAVGRKYGVSDNKIRKWLKS